MQKAMTIFALIVAAIAIAAAFGPRPSRDETIVFNASSIGPDVDVWLKQSESVFPDIRPGAEKAVVWADPATRARTRVAIVYVHGFSATRREISPVAENVAAMLGANLFFTRLAGHGRTGEAMGSVSMKDWVNDLAEAVAIGERIGERVVLIGTSTGGTLATLAAARPQLSGKLAALVLVSPNFALNGVSTGLLNMPWAETLLPLLFGQTRSFEPNNAEHAKWWTTSYPSAAVFPMGALLRTVEMVDFATLKTPALFMFSPEDKVVAPMTTREVHARWGGPKEIVEVKSDDDPSHHVIAGDILGKSNNALFVETIAGFIGRHL